jgi:hypothetical protein
MSVYAHKSSDAQWDIYHTVNGSPLPVENWIKHRLYRYSQTGGDQWGWNGTRVGSVRAGATYNGQDAGWTYYYASAESPWSNVDSLSNGTSLKQWEASPNGVPDADYAEHAIVAGSTHISLYQYGRHNRQVDMRLAWVTASGERNIARSDIHSLGLMVWDDGLLGPRSDIYLFTPTVLSVPSDATGIRIYPQATNGGTGTGTWCYVGDLICHLAAACNPGDAGWTWLPTAILQGEATSDDISIRLREGASGDQFVTGPSHKDKESQTIALSADDGANVFAEPVGTLVSGDAITATINSDVRSPDVGNVVGSLHRQFVWSNYQLDYAANWTKIAAHTVVTAYTAMHSCGEEYPRPTNDTDTRCLQWCDLGNLAVYVGNASGYPQSQIGTASKYRLFGTRGISVEVTKSNASNVVFVATNTRKVHEIHNAAAFNALEIGQSLEFATRYAYFGATSPLAWYLPKTYVFASPLLEHGISAIVPTELASSLNAKILKGWGETASVGMPLQASVLTSAADASIGGIVSLSASQAPLPAPVVGNWSGVTVSGGTLANCRVRYATTGINQSGGHVVNCIVDTCTTAMTSTGGTSANNIIDGSQQLDAYGIPIAGGNCDVGRGDASARPGVGQPDLYDRPKLRGDADCIGPVYPQRHDPAAILQPMVRFPTEV